MKKYLFMILAFIATLMFSCKENPYMPAPGDTTYVPDTMPEMAHPDPTPDPEGAVVPDGTLNVFDARKLCSNLASGAVTEDKYYVKGWIHKLDGKNEEGITKYGNATFYFSATNDGKTDDEDFEAYQVYGKDGKPLKSVDEVAVGDFVVIYGQLTNYNNKAYETVGKGAAYIYYSNNPNFGKEPQLDSIHATCAEAKDAALALASGASSTEIYVVEGYVQSAGYDATISKGQQKWFWIDDTKSGSKVLEAYWCNVPDGTTPVPVGAKIRLTGKLMNYNGTVAEIKNGDIEILEQPE